MAAENGTKKNYPRLCGGTFLALVLQATKKRRTAAEHMSGKADPINDYMVLQGLALVFDPSLAARYDYMASHGETSSLPTDTTNYKKCVYSTTANFPFNDDTKALSAFSERVTNEYVGELKSMDNFVRSFIETDKTVVKAKLLIRRILGAIKEDESIDSSQPFYCLESGSPITKAELISSTRFCLPALLLGVWHYALVISEKDRCERDEDAVPVGQETFSMWHVQKGEKKTTYVFKGKPEACISQEIVLEEISDKIVSAWKKEDEIAEKARTESEYDDMQLLVTAIKNFYDMWSKDEPLIQNISDSFDVFNAKLSEMETASDADEEEPADEEDYCIADIDDKISDECKKLDALNETFWGVVSDFLAISSKMRQKDGITQNVFDSLNSYMDTATFESGTTVSFWDVPDSELEFGELTKNISEFVSTREHFWNVYDLFLAEEFDDDENAHSIAKKFAANRQARLSIKAQIDLLSQHVGLVASAGEFVNYLVKLRNEHAKMKTYVNSEEYREFYSFYVPNDVGRGGRYPDEVRLIGEVSAETILGVSHCVIIVGTGGLGKSMMMHHLALSAIAKYDALKLLPVFIQLKDFTHRVKKLEDLIFGEVASLGSAITKKMFNSLLDTGKFLFLFDGWDEVSMPEVERFEEELSRFVKIHEKCGYVLSSRPFKSFVSFHKFTELKLQLFTLDQAAELVKKLRFRADVPRISENFIDELQKGLYVRQTEFAGNPLLLTIMLRTYARTGEIPEKHYKFYEEAYNTLAAEHDANKGFARKLRTNLSKDEFATLFAEICYFSYKDGKYSLTENEFKNYFKKSVKLDEKNVNADDFLFDSHAHLCLMYPERGEYRFMHRSFQEYFCALSLYRKLTIFTAKSEENRTEFSKRRIDFFEKHSGADDKALLMLYEMIREKVEEYIFIPFLDNLFAQYNEDGGDPYWSFLLDMHETIFYAHGESVYQPENPATSSLFKFIADNNPLPPIARVLWTADLPPYNEFVTEAYDEYGNNIGKIRLSEGDYADGRELPEPAERQFEMSVERVLRRPREYEDIIDMLRDDHFVLKREYFAARSYLQAIKARQKTSDDGILDCL